MLQFIIFMLFLLSGICLGIMDKLMFHYHTSVFSKLNPKWWNPNVAWINKYELDEDGIPVRDPATGKYKRKKWNIFGLSITRPKVGSDAWGTFKSIHLNLLAIAIGLLLPFSQYWWIDAILFRFALGGGFNAAYNWMFDK